MPIPTTRDDYVPLSYHLPDESDSVDSLMKLSSTGSGSISSSDVNTLSIPPDTINGGPVYEEVPKNPKPNMKFDEEQYIQELLDYITKTYEEHYAYGDKLQVYDVIHASGNSKGFCIGNILKYASRLYKKGTPEDARKDILKILHYAVLLLYAHDNEEA